MKKIAALLIMLALATALNANNIAISNLSLTGKNTESHYTLVQFDISWENSWRTSVNESNWDAAWVFVKYRVAGGAWQHAWLDESGHTAPAGSTITPGMLNPGAAFNATTNPGLGAFIYRSADGASGTFAKTGVQLRWNYGANGVADGDQVDIKVFAIEMVYVPQGAFAAGSGGSEFYKFTLTSINTGIATTAPSGTGSLGGAAGGYPSGQTTPDNAHWPNGFNAFYCQKYEISQQQYVDFLNTLTQTQADKRKKTSSSCRYAITGSVAGSYATTNPYVACNYLNWMDGAAYSDWAGLRPMSELEYEKACRGPATPVANEYAWGNTTAIAANNITNPGTASETTSTEGANAVYGYQTNVLCPMRVGVFAKASTTRTQSGSSYYGIMELSGNLYERAVTVGNEAGRAFTGVHGNGLLCTSGNANVVAWPGLTNGEISGATGSGLRGGDWADDAMIMRASDRIHAAITDTVRTSFYGFRGVRTQPPFTCGISTLTINHLATGGVAPVDKTVTYGTVTSIPGELTKCWITRNLGAAQQAKSVTDDTEASAGWYWQFNRKQGWEYKTSRVPVTPAWDATNDNLSATWEAAKDPCTLELGTGWRIPTKTEWTNVDASGNWTNWNGPYGSALKLHAAGALQMSDGSLLWRGSYSYNRSSTQKDATLGWSLAFDGRACYMGDLSKASAYSIRCIKDLLPTLTTTDASVITDSTASSGGNVTDDGGSTITARGVCWGTATAPTTALATKTTNGTGTGTYTSSITGLAASTLYYVRAYATNSTGTSYGNEISFTSAAFVCGTSSLSIKHVTANGVAPVDKTVSYGTVSTALFGGTKCVITKNLGATKQAASATDNAEASAGWYWQFNRKQGWEYKTSRVPVSPSWDNTNDNSSEIWETAKDPCAIELGTGWRIPTKTEWATADGSPQNWGSAVSTYNSVLKIHTAGYLSSSGTIANRGSYGQYWSSTQDNAINAWNLYFSGSGFCMMYPDYKYYGFSVRCLRDLLPTLTTATVTSITSTTASSGGNVTNDGGSSITARGVCWSTTANPLATGSHTTNDGTTGVFTSSITGLSSGTLYYVRAYATNGVGTTYGNELSFTTQLEIGAAYQGGVVAYILQPADPGYDANMQKGLIAATEDQSTGIIWAITAYQSTLLGGTGDAIGTGIANTNRIIAQNGAGSTYAAGLARAYTGGSYNDWYLPSRNELYKLFLNRTAIGGFDPEFYFSSSESSATNAWTRGFADGLEGSYQKRFGYYVRAVRSFPTLPTITTTAATSITTTTATSGGNVTSAGDYPITARGVCWSTSHWPTTALTTITIETGTTGIFISNLSDLANGTTYYVRAYATSSAGTSYGNEVSFTTAVPFVCGTSTITVNHVTSGGVAPVDKTVTYGTVTNIPGETTKCWITRNLGAAQQAATVEDATEAFAGWYWQFNRKQGWEFKTSLVPVTPAWDATNDNLSETWEASKDPCTLELGTGWRIPTYTEWLNVKVSGSWTDWNGPFSSDLKLHAAGYLDTSGGSLFNRGVGGLYWSSGQSDPTNGCSLSFNPGNCSMFLITKAFGFSARCIRD